MEVISGCAGLMNQRFLDSLNEDEMDCCFGLVNDDCQFVFQTASTLSLCYTAFF